MVVLLLSLLLCVVIGADVVSAGVVVVCVFAFCLCECLLACLLWSLWLLVVVLFC